MPILRDQCSAVAEAFTALGGDVSKTVTVNSLRDDIDNPVAPDWFRERHDSDPEGKEPLIDPKTGHTVPSSGYDPGRFFGIDANNLDPDWYMQEGFICGGDWESPSLQTKHIAGDCINLNLEIPQVKEYLNNEFSFESFTPETVFYVLPVFEDVLRGGMLDMSSRVRRSNFSYKITGTKIRIFPIPTQSNPKSLFIRVHFSPDPMNPSFKDASIDGISNLSNIPYGRLTYSRVNSIGRQWIRQYSLALSRELLGLIRSKFSSVPIPGADLQLNGTELVSQGREDKESLKTKLAEMLDELTYDKMLESEAAASENLTRILKAMRRGTNSCLLFTSPSPRD